MKGLPLRLSFSWHVVTPDAHRVFFALWPAEAVARAFHGAASRAQKICGGRVIGPDKVHLTLAFVGAVKAGQRADLLEIGASLALPACELVFDRIGCFARNAVVWAGCDRVPAALREHVRVLQMRLSSAGFRMDDRPYVPHVTLLRNARCGELPNMETAIVWSAEEWRLVESRTEPSGAHYYPLARWVSRRDQAPPDRHDDASDYSADGP